MSYPITITGKRQWQEDGSHYMECFCNGVRLVERYMGQPAKKDLEHMERNMKNACKAMKVWNTYDPKEINAHLVIREDRLAFGSCDLPEWNA